MKKRFPAAIAGVAVAALALAGCSDPGANAGNENAGGTEAGAWPAQDASLDGTTLTIWAAQNSNKIPESVILGFEELTGATVEVETIPDPYEQGVQTRVASGDKPDLAFWQPTASMLTALNASTNLQPLDDAPFLEAYAPGLRDITGILDDTRYAALITTPAVEGVYYNKQVLADAGITETPGNWDEMLEAARTIKDQGGTPFFDFGAPVPWATQWWVQVQLADAAADGLWDRVNSGEEKFTDETIQGAISTYNDLIEEGLFNDDLKTATFEDQGAALLAGDAAMAVQVNSFFGQLQSLADTDELNEKIGFFPISPSGNVGTFIPDQSNALVAFKTDDANREAGARQLLSYWLGDGYADFVEAQQSPSLQSDVPSPAGVPEALTAVSDSLGDSIGSMQALAIVNPDLYLNLGDMLQGTQTPEQVAETTQAQFEQLAQAIGAAGF
ncbi:ABC transporter substrate-binding protein [Microbacterium oleivorans]|uniref:Carbohydrate ABC transporter substrate-binding protein n=1 Tax=Microbacterium oleivorans TaxID=273677 RepID=A0A4R5YKY9_9MICO|nr:ABC transporter substrate-binding protein [Microbacterium oleivorans]TDL45241.1 carbohydrate ABC transporter substrate-binding protein [Microbacterium oleivorans]